MNKKKKRIYLMLYASLFTSLSFIGCSIKIPVINGTVHLGNFFCILSALLINPFVGGFSGSLGMGLNDIIFYGFSLTTLRTIIVKFIMGLTCGFIFKKIDKENRNRNILAFISVFIAILINIIGEMTFIFFQNIFEKNMTIDGSFIVTCSKLPSRLITGIVTMIFCVAIFPSLYKINKIKILSDEFKTNKFKKNHSYSIISKDKNDSINIELHIKD